MVMEIQYNGRALICKHCGWLISIANYYSVDVDWNNRGFSTTFLRAEKCIYLWHQIAPIQRRIPLIFVLLFQRHPLTGMYRAVSIILCVKRCSLPIQKRIWLGYQSWDQTLSILRLASLLSEHKFHQLWENYALANKWIFQELYLSHWE